MKKAQPPYSYGGEGAQHSGYHSPFFKIVKSISISYSLLVLGICLVKSGTYPLPHIWEARF